MTNQIRAVFGRHQHPGRAGTASAEGLLDDAADGSDHTVRRDLTRPSHVLPAIERPWRDGIDDAQCEHHASARAAHVSERDVDVKRETVLSATQDADHRCRAVVFRCDHAYCQVHGGTVALDD